MRRILALILVALPVAAFALDFTDVTEQYADAPFPRPEAIGISVLTHLGAVQGNPDGTFQPRRAVNRAEFLKIVFLSHKNIQVLAGDASDCFPDVRKTDWFSRYVCLAKTRKVVKGYPDGKYHPENPVNYAEALKMLGELYGVVAETPSGEWYVPYREGAYAAGVGLPGMEGRMDEVLTRGQIARLVAAYRAYMEGELNAYRLAELGTRVRSSAGSSSSVASIVYASSDSSASSVSSTSSMPSLFPARSHQLLVGSRTPVLFDGTFESVEDAALRTVRVTLARELTSIEKLYLVDASGSTVGELTLDTNDNTSKTKWMRDFDPAVLTLSAGKPVTLGIQALLKPRGGGGGARDVFELKNTDSFTINVQGVANLQNRQLSPRTLHAPISETVVARLEGVLGTLPLSGELTSGKNRLIAAFTFTGTVLPGSTLTLEALSFQIDAPGVTVTNWKIGSEAEFEQQACGVDATFVSLINCAVIPEAFRDIASPTRAIGIYGDVSVRPGALDPQLQIWMTKRGTIGSNQTGDVFWNDGSGVYRWVEEWVPLGQGPRWRVKP